MSSHYQLKELHCPRHQERSEWTFKFTSELLSNLHRLEPFVSKKHPGCGWELRKPGEDRSSLHLALPGCDGAGQQLSAFVLRDRTQKRAWEPAAPAGLWHAISGKLFEHSWTRCSHHIFFAKKCFLLWKKEKSADCHLKVSVQNQCSVIGFGNNSLSTVSLVLFASEKLFVVVVVIFCFLFHIFSLCSPGWPQTCELLLQDPSCWH